ncbi:MAG: glycoside hydrolase family 9 protein [Micromonosporaceae bacterium]
MYASPGAAASGSPPAGTSGRRGRGGGGDPAALIRVDQVGYPSAAPKTAEVMVAPGQPGGFRWILVRRGNCAVAASGEVGPYAGSWSSRYPRVWKITFSGVGDAGEYRLGLVSGPHAASPWFAIAPATRLYAKPLANARSFYSNERDGPAFIPSRLRTAPGHLNDARAMTYQTPPMKSSGRLEASLVPYATGTVINASGGWFDAGDYLKFAETATYTVAALLQGIMSFPGQLGARGQVSYLAEARFGLDFLQRLWQERTRTLYYQVGIEEADGGYAGDHDIWRLPQADDQYGGSDPRYMYIRHPPVLRAAAPGSPISPNLAGRFAADFALCYRAFRVTDPAYAAGCLRSAETVYALAGTHWTGPLLTAAPFAAYPETSWQDDMMLGAAELSLALRAAGDPARLPAGLEVRSAAAYLREAARWARAWMRGPLATRDTLNLYDVSGLADYELAQAMTLEHAGGLAITRAEAIGHLRAQLQEAVDASAEDPFGFGFAWDQADTAAHGAGLSVMANEYDALTGRGAFAGQAQRWLDAILGANAWGASFIIGDGTVFPHCPSHQVANLAGSLDGKPPVIAGATVEGPARHVSTGAVPHMRACSAAAAGGVPYAVFDGHGAVFGDNVQSYSTTEPAIDLTALTPLAFAWQAHAAAHGTVPAAP